MNDRRHSPANDAETPNTVEMEITDLASHAPAGGASRVVRAISTVRRLRRVRWLLATLTALIAVAILAATAAPWLGNSISTLFAVPTATATVSPTPIPTATLLPTSTPYPTPTHSPLTTLDPAPRDCPLGPARQTISQEFGPVVGGTPVWVDWPFSATSTPLTIHVANPTPDKHTLYGWPVPLLIAATPQYTKPVSVQAWNASTGVPLWFAHSAAGDSSPTYVVQLSLDPTQPDGVSGDGYPSWFPTLYIPISGCYVMQASWPGGTWKIPFAAGA